MTYRFYQYPRCSTCVKARKWLEAHQIDITSIDLTVDTPDVETLRAIHIASTKPIKALFNTSGQSYRKGDFKSRLPDMSLDEMLSALAADGKLIKRPLLVSETGALIGFKEAEWAAMCL